MVTPYNVSHLPSPPPELIPRHWLPNWLSSKIPNPSLLFSKGNNSRSQIANHELVEPSDELRRFIKNPKHPAHNPSPSSTNAMDVAFHLEPEPDPDPESEPMAATAILGQADVPHDGLHDIRKMRKWDYTQSATGRWLAENKRLDEIARRRYNLWKSGTRWQCLKPNCDWNTEVDIDDFTGKEIKLEMCGRKGCRGKRLKRIEGGHVNSIIASSYPIIGLRPVNGMIKTRIPRPLEYYQEEIKREKNRKAAKRMSRVGQPSHICHGNRGNKPPQPQASPPDAIRRSIEVDSSTTKNGYSPSRGRKRKALFQPTHSKRRKRNPDKSYNPKNDQGDNDSSMNEGKRTKGHSATPPVSKHKRKDSAYKHFGENSSDDEDDGKRQDRKRFKSSSPKHPSKRQKRGHDGDGVADTPTDPPAKNTRASWKTKTALALNKTSHENSKKSKPHDTVNSKGRGKTKRAIQGRNTTSKPDEKHIHIDLDLSSTRVDMVTRPFAVKVTPTSKTFLRNKHHAREQLNELVLVENRSRNSRESAPSPEPSPPLGIRMKSARPTAKTTTASSMASTALNKGSRALTSKKEVNQQTKNTSARVTRSNGIVDIAQLSATNKAMTAKKFPKSFSNVPKMAESGMAKTKVTKLKDTPELTKTNRRAKAVVPVTLRTIVTQPTAIIPSISKPKKRSAFARRFSEHVRNAWMYADSY